MADIFGGIQPPAWLSKITTPVEPGETGRLFAEMIGGMGKAYLNSKEKNDAGEQTTWLKELPSAIHDAQMDVADPMWRLKVQSAQLKIGEQKLQMDAQQEALTAKKTQMAWMSEDMQNVGQWMRDNPTPEDRATNPPPMAKTPQYQKALQSIQKIDVNVDAQRDFSKQVDELRKIDPVAASRYAPLIGRPIPKNASEQLGKDMDSAKAKVFKAQSPLGKLEADRLAAESGGAPPEVLAAYDSAIQKATEVGGLYGEKPEVIDVEGKKFLKWGKQLRDLSGSSAEDKAKLGVLTSKIRSLQNELIKNPEEPEKASGSNSLTRQLRRSQEELDTIFSKTQDTKAAPAPTEQSKPGGEVERMTKDGKKAVFDSQSHKFLRYAQ